ncbi:SAICAR synthetase [Choiromyces venosus 120613-1]|uniref:Phosphoribosylaminoimidazole-succinocarboxamide synthase n=1 Tax=Choiromyces venosus 120613-1 TaxID=1336337 RepID=A0A3N4K4C7_9PEZI|nr:SAICAR synthetase [Choiromyces venosus 120613-1]
MALTCTDLRGTLPLLAQGKVRDVYTLSADHLLFVATDRISAYDVIMKNGIPNKGKLLTGLSEFWFTTVLKDVGPNHFVSSSLESLPKKLQKYSAQLKDRSMVVKKLKVFPVEAIVRGYLTGSSWVEYQKSGTVHGIRILEGMVESQAFEKPLFTPSTKAAQGQHDENIHPDKVAQLVGNEYAKKIEELSLALYTKARDYAAERGIIIADTKFEFGLDENKNVVLVDEVLTPVDSSRFWLASSYEVGRSQDSYDKQFLRDWLTKNGVKGRPGIEMPEEIVRETSKKYHEAFELLTGNAWKET